MWLVVVSSVEKEKVEKFMLHLMSTTRIYFEMLQPKSLVWIISALYVGDLVIHCLFSWLYNNLPMILRKIQILQVINRFKLNLKLKSNLYLSQEFSQASTLHKTRINGSVDKLNTLTFNTISNFAMRS